MVLVTGTACVLWIVGAVLFLGLQNRQVEHVGLLLLLIAATLTALGVLRSWQLRMHRAFVHGYHAGYHDATKREQRIAAEDCDVLELAEVKARRLSQMG